MSRHLFYSLCAASMKCFRVLFSVPGIYLFFCEVAVGLGKSDERQVGTGTDGTLAGGVSLILSVCLLAIGLLLVVVLDGDTGYSSWLGKSIQHPIVHTFLLQVVGIVMHQALPQLSKREKNRPMLAGAFRGSGQTSRVGSGPVRSADPTRPATF